MKIFAFVAILLLSFNAVADDEVPAPAPSTGVLLPFGDMLQTMTEGNPLEQAAAMLYVSGVVDSFRMLKLICPDPSVSDVDVLTESVGILGVSATLVLADQEKLQENLALPTSFYLLAGLRLAYPCQKSTE